ncbi:MAG: hypothetical protein KDK54_20105, partial [Leptospiraceae bacterium]|nr:hypothetical protein [Leptospiraceae bacterium]
MNILRRERRKRERIPGAILFVGILCLFYPIINYLQFVYYFELNAKEFSSLMGRLNLIQKILLVFPFLSGIGLLTVSIYGFILFCINALLLIIFNIYAIAKYLIKNNWMALGETILVTGLFLFIIRKDIYIPFGKFSTRGFRYAKRKIIPRKLEIVSKEI